MIKAFVGIYLLDLSACHALAEALYYIIYLHPYPSVTSGSLRLAICFHLQARYSTETTASLGTPMERTNETRTEQQTPGAEDSEHMSNLDTVTYVSMGMPGYGTTFETNLGLVPEIRRQGE
jgi:hypothetical protein